MVTQAPPSQAPLTVDLDLSSGDLAFTAGGALALVAGPALVQQQIYRRLYDARGALLFEPTRGAGLSSWIGQPLSPADQATIAQTVSDQCQAMAAVASVQGVSVTQQGQGILVVTPNVTLQGTTTSTALPIVIGGGAVPLILAPPQLPTPPPPPPPPSVSVLLTRLAQGRIATMVQAGGLSESTAIWVGAGGIAALMTSEQGISPDAIG